MNPFVAIGLMLLIFVSIVVAALLLARRFNSRRKTARYQFEDEVQRAEEEKDNHETDSKTSIDG